MKYHDRYKIAIAALKDIEICEHVACNSSCKVCSIFAAWAIADKALHEIEEV